MDRVKPGQIVVDVNGVGYGVQVIPQLAAAQSVGDAVALRVVTIVREDAISLYGFDDDVSADIFDALIGVTGVGPRSAMAVLAHLTPAQIVSAVGSDDDAAFTRVTGIGPKTAKLICVQLAGKLGDVPAVGAPVTGASASETENLVAALTGLGWNEKTARKALDGIATEGKASEQILREALSVLGGQP